MATDNWPTNDSGALLCPWCPPNLRLSECKLHNPFHLHRKLDDAERGQAQLRREREQARRERNEARGRLSVEEGRRKRVEENAHMLCRERNEARRALNTLAPHVGDNGRVKWLETLLAQKEEVEAHNRTLCQQHGVRIKRLMDENDRLKVQLEAARTGQPLGPLVGAQTIVELAELLKEARRLMKTVIWAAPTRQTEAEDLLRRIAEVLDD